MQWPEKCSREWYRIEAESSQNVIVVVEIVNPIGFPSEFGDILIYICLTSNAQARHRPDSGDWGHTRPCSNKVTHQSKMLRRVISLCTTALDCTWLHCTVFRIRTYSNQVALAVIARSAADTPVEVPGRKSLKRDTVQKLSYQVTNL